MVIKSNIAGNIEKFVIDREFSNCKSLARTTLRYTDDDLKQRTTEAHQAGFQQGYDDAQKSIQAALLETYSSISCHGDEVVSRLRHERTGLRSEALELALASARGVVGSVLDVIPHEVIKSVLEQAVDTMRGQPQLVVTVGSDVFDEAQTFIDDARSRGIVSEDISVVPSSTMTSGMAEVSWKSGGLTHDPHHRLSQVEEMVRSRLASHLEERDDLSDAASTTEGIETMTDLQPDEPQ